MGSDVGNSVGNSVGRALGAWLGDADGVPLGLTVGAAVGDKVNEHSMHTLAAVHPVVVSLSTLQKAYPGKGGAYAEQFPCSAVANTGRRVAVHVGAFGSHSLHTSSARHTRPWIKL